MDLFAHLVSTIYHATATALGDITLDRIIGSVFLYLIIHPIVDLLTRIYRLMDRLYVRSLKWLFGPIIRRLHAWVLKNERRAAYYRQIRRDILSSAVTIESSIPDHSEPLDHLLHHQ
jgi:hypothetical protein